MKNILFAILAVLFLSVAGSGCVDANVSIDQAVVDHNGDPQFSFTIPGCSPSLEVYFPCPTAVPATTINLPGFTQKIDISLPAGADAHAHVTRLDVRDTNGNDLSVIQSLTVEVAADGGLHTYPFFDAPNTGYGPAITLIPTADIDLVPFVEAPSTTFTISFVVAGPVPTADETFALDVSIYFSASASYEKSL